MDHKSKNSVWFTITDLDGNIIGETGLLRMFPAWHQTDLTIIIPDPKMQHKGYGTEAIRIMLDMAFNKYEMHRVSIGVVGLNTDALEFYKKIGFKQEGIPVSYTHLDVYKRQEYLWRSDWNGTSLYSIPVRHHQFCFYHADADSCRASGQRPGIRHQKTAAKSTWLLFSHGIVLLSVFPVLRTVDRSIFVCQ